MIGNYNRVHSRLLQKIVEMVNMGVTKRTEMKRHLESFVLDKYPDADREDAAYYPTLKIISVSMYNARMKMRYDKMDEKNVLCMVQEWQKKYPADFNYYRPKTAEDDVVDIEDNDEDDVAFQIPCLNKKKLKSSLLFIHQSAAQRLLLKRYNNLVLMDATYRTCRLALPLFLLVVKTNVAYMPVATFITQTEDAASLMEALSILKNEWQKHDIQVKNFMIDCSPTEIHAIKEVFPESGLFLCDFHRLQSWGRWLRTKANGAAQHYNEVMNIFKRLGYSMSIAEYRKVEQELKQCDIYKKNKKLQNYYRKWEAQKEVRFKFL